MLVSLTSRAFQVGITDFASISSWHRWLREQFKLASILTVPSQSGTCSASDGDISKWDKSSVYFMVGMFAFDGDISKGDVFNVNVMTGMFVF